MLSPFCHIMLALWVWGKGDRDANEASFTIGRRGGTNGQLAKRGDDSDRQAGGCLLPVVGDSLFCFGLDVQYPGAVSPHACGRRWRSAHRPMVSGGRGEALWGAVRKLAAGAHCVCA